MLKDGKTSQPGKTIVPRDGRPAELETTTARGDDQGKPGTWVTITDKSNGKEISSFFVPDGEAGAQGAKGEKGERGDKGPRGERGKDGEPGEDGALENKVQLELQYILLALTLCQMAIFRLILVMVTISLFLKELKVIKAKRSKRRRFKNYKNRRFT